jgi:hypothetical protein
MTIDNVGPLPGTGVETAWCSWFEKDGKNQGVRRTTFPLTSLMEYVDGT